MTNLLNAYPRHRRPSGLTDAERLAAAGVASELLEAGVGDFEALHDVCDANMVLLAHMEGSGLDIFADFAVAERITVEADWLAFHRRTAAEARAAYRRLRQSGALAREARERIHEVVPHFRHSHRFDVDVRRGGRR